MILDKEFKFSLAGDATKHTYSARRSDEVYDIYLIQGIEFNKEVVDRQIEQGKWVVIK